MAITGVHLTRTEENVAGIDALAGVLERVGVHGLLDDLDRKGRRTYAPFPFLLGRKVSKALTWDAADRRDPRWWPQGISHSLRTDVERPTLAVSWYSKDGHGSRVSFFDLASRRYRHALLVEPTIVDGTPGIKPVKVHAGGIVWHGPYVHVAATGRGFLTFRLDDVLRVDAAARAEAAIETYGHEYVLPVRFAYKAVTDDGIERLRYSFLALDRSTDPESIVAGEYARGDQTRRFARLHLDPGTGLLATDEDGFSRPLVDERGQVRMQGVAVIAGRYYITSSEGHHTHGTVHVGSPGAFRSHRFATPMGPEDLSWWPGDSPGGTDVLWSVSEHPRRRWLFAMRKSRLPGPS